MTWLGACGLGRGGDLIRKRSVVYVRIPQTGLVDPADLLASARPKANPGTRPANLQYGTLGQPEDVIEATLTADARCLRPRSLIIRIPISG
jgi:hypothetical protein